MGDADFDKAMGPNKGSQKSGSRTIDTVRDRERERSKKKNDFKPS